MTLRVRLPAFPTVAAAVASGLIAAGCGEGGMVDGDNGRGGATRTHTATSTPVHTPTPITRVPLAEFTDRVCATWDGYAAALSRLDHVFDDVDVDDARAVKRAFLEELGRTVDAARVLTRAGEELPAPDVPGGIEIRDMVLGEFASQQARIIDYRDAVRDAPDDDPQVLAEELAAIPLGENRLRINLRDLEAVFPAAGESIVLIESRPDGCRTIFTA